MHLQIIISFKSDVDYFRSEFRTIRGTCNNPTHLFWGAQGIAMRRFVEAAYSDGVGAPLGGNRAVQATARALQATSR